ncbi:MAG TPA: VOC family protein [Candidatus Eisenbacteria bacterium]|nr:VOC family protein [Candidatus Eisenbacteria bacterium]
MIKAAIPLLHVSSAAAAQEFYCAGLGFKLEFAQRGDPALSDPCYMGLSRDGVWIHLSSFSGDGVAGGVVNFAVEDVDALHGEFVTKRVPIAVAPVDQTWGTREMYVKDVDGNSLRFQC